MSSSYTKSNAGEFCSLPLVIRAYMAAVVGVAVFLAVILGLRDPFRGYQTEVRLRGTASEAIDPVELRDWLRRADPATALAINGGTQSRPEVQVRIGRTARRLTEATATLDALARRTLLEYLPQAQAAYRQRLIGRLEHNLQQARNAEEALAAQSRDLAAHPPMPAELTSEATTPESTPPMELVESAPPATRADAHPLHRQLEALRLELARLLANFTDEHPQVAAIRRQIDNLEQQFGEQPAVPSPEWPSSHIDSHPAPPARPASFTSFPASEPPANASPVDSVNSQPAAQNDQLQRITSELSAATAARQSAERKLHTTLAALSLQTPTAGWTADPARLVTRLGGTPRMLTLMLSLVGALLAGILMFRVTRVLVGPQLLATTNDLARALPIPLVGLASTPHKPRPARAGRWITPARVRLLTRGAETWLVVLLVLCVIAVCLDHALASQFALDPLGVLSEIVGRFTGR